MPAVTIDRPAESTVAVVLSVVGFMKERKGPSFTPPTEKNSLDDGTEVLGIVLLVHNTETALFVMEDV